MTSISTAACPACAEIADLTLRGVDGVFFLRGRSDDTLKVAGKRLGSAEVEEVVLALPGVAEAAAIGVDDPLKGQRLVIFLVPRADAPPGLEAAATGAVETQLGRAFRPGAVHVVAELPKTRSQKIMRRVIRNLYAGQPPGDLTALDNPAALGAVSAVAPG